MKFTLTITLGNDAMQSGEDLSVAVEAVSRQLDALGSEPLTEDTDAYDRQQRVRDINGNTVGQWRIS